MKPYTCVTESVQIPIGGPHPMTGYLARPTEVQPIGAIIVGMELFGVTAHVRDVCDRLAGLGYVALAPDLYHRSAPGIELPADGYGRTRGFELLGQLTREQALDDIRATVEHLADRATPLTGMVGLSVGGHVAYLAATQLNLPAAVVFYGGWIPTTDIPLGRPVPTIAATAGITGRILMLVGGEDPIVPREDRRQIEDALTAAGVEHEVVEYPGVGHGFLCDRRESFHRRAADDAWERLTEFLARG